MLIRPEQVSDYADIGALHARAFANRSLEAVIVMLLRQRRAFDPELSLVAEENGQIVGHVLFSPYQMRLLGQTLPIVNLAPLAVDPVYQRRGVGGQLIIKGHAIAATRGYALSILLGHSSYYPRFGYRTHAFGSSQLAIPIRNLPREKLDARAPTSEDLAALNALWRHEEGAVDMALEPGFDLLDWFSPDPEIHATVYTRHHEVVGYTRSHVREPNKPRVFLARDHQAARAIVATMVLGVETAAPDVECILPLHPASASAGAFGQAICSSWEAAMACSLSQSSLLDEYLALVASGQRVPGRVTWPTAFDLE